jgi:hypothetical protein
VESNLAATLAAQGDLAGARGHEVPRVLKASPPSRVGCAEPVPRDQREDDLGVGDRRPKVVREHVARLDGGAIEEDALRIEILREVAEQQGDFLKLWPT